MKFKTYFYNELVVAVDVCLRAYRGHQKEIIQSINIMDLDIFHFFV